MSGVVYKIVFPKVLKDTCNFKSYGSLISTLIQWKDVEVES